MKNYLNITFEKGEATASLSTKPIGEETDHDVMSEECLHGDIYIDDGKKKKFEKKISFFIDLKKFIKDVNEENKRIKNKIKYTHLAIKCDVHSTDNWNPGQYYIFCCDESQLKQEKVKLFDITKQNFKGTGAAIRISNLLTGQIKNRIDNVFTF